MGANTKKIYLILQTSKASNFVVGAFESRTDAKKEATRRNESPRFRGYFYIQAIDLQAKEETK